MHETRFMGLFDFFRKDKGKDKEKDKEKDKDKEQSAEDASLESGLEKTKTSFFSRLAKAVAGKSTIDDEVLDNLEEVLVTSDVGVETTLKIIDRVRARVARDKYLTTSELEKILRDEIRVMITEQNATYRNLSFDVPQPTQDGRKVPYVIMVVGVNGVGKTTTIGKLACRFKEAGYQVVIGAADTFRAAAVDQLKIWADRAGVPMVDLGMGADPASVAFQAVKIGYEQNADLVIIDTAGRLHNKINLMNELSKIKRSMSKTVIQAPHEVLLVLDASTGQNAVSQATEFTKATQVTALVLTKLDGTAKGGVVISIMDQFKIPVKFIGVGEGIRDLQLFEPALFVESLFKK